MTDRSTRILLAVIVLASAATCAWFASSRLGPKRAWDERYSLRNVEAILKTGNLRPVFAWYPSLSHLPQTAVLAASQAAHRATGIEALAIFDADGDLTPSAYLQARWTNVVFGVGALLLTFVVARRVFSREVGLLATFFVAASPTFLRAVGIYKPDPLFLFLTLLVFLWSLDAGEKGSLGRYLLAGVGVGLAASSKQTGALSATALAAATAFHFRDRIRWLWLAAAGLASVVVFLLLNPYLDLLPEYLSIANRYEHWASARETRLGPPPTLFSFLIGLQLDRNWHNVVFGSAVLVGYAGLVVKTIRLRLQGRAELPLTLFVVFPVAYTLACALVSTYPKKNIYLPLLPFTTIAGAWLLKEAWTRVAGKLTATGRRRLFWPGLAALLAIPLSTTVPYVYLEAVPETTLGLAGSLIAYRAPFLPHRTVIYEPDLGRIVARSDHLSVSAWAREVPSLRSLEQAELNLADYEVFPERWLTEGDSTFYFRRMLRVDARSILFLKAELLRRRGSNQVLLEHLWEVQGPALDLEWSRRKTPTTEFEAKLPRRQLRRAQAISFDFEVSDAQVKSCSASLGDSPLALHTYRTAKRRVWRMSPRFRAKKLNRRLRVTCREAQRFADAPIVQVWRWADPVPPKPRRRVRATPDPSP